MFSPPIRSKRGSTLAREYSNKFLKLKITECHIKVEQLKRVEKTMRIKLKTQLQTNLELFHQLLLHVNNSKTSVKSQTKKRHDKKLEKLRYGQSSNQSEQASRNQHIKQKWVHNLSSKSLTHTQTGVPEKGFSFALSPKSLPMVDIICGVEEGLRKVNDAAAVSTARLKSPEY